MAKWKTPIICPDCGSSAVRRREVVHKSGTSEYKSSGSTSGVSFSFSGKSHPRYWLGGGSTRGVRQSLLARESQPVPFWPAILLVVFIFIFRGDQGSFGILSWLGFLVSGLWLAAAWRDISRYEEQWLCGKCGARFIPEAAEERQSSMDRALINENALDKSRSLESSETSNRSGKACSICGKWFPAEEFCYGNRSNQSYCKQCNKEEHAARQRGGNDGAKKFRDTMRAKSGK